MKLWSVLPEFLPDSLLFREHQTVHAILNGVLAGKPRRGITRYLRYGGYLVWRHFLAVDEMRIRGAKHESFVDLLWKKLPENRRRFDYPLTKEAVAADLSTIKGKIVNPNKGGRMDNPRTPIARCGTQLLDAQRRLVAAGTLPKDALLL